MSRFLLWYAHKVKKHPKSILGLGLLVVVMMTVFGIGFGGSLSSEGMTIDNTPAQKAADIVSKNYHSSTSGAQAQIMLKAKESLKNKNNVARITDIKNKIQRQEDVQTVMTPDQLFNYAQHDKVAYITVTFNTKAITEKQSTALTKVVNMYRASNFEVELSGIASNIEVSETPEVIGIGIAFIILVITFGSFLIAGLPIISALLGLITGLAGIFGVARFTDVASYDLSLAAMVSLAVGIDYALFMVARYRDEYVKTNSDKAIYMALTKTGPAIIFAAATIIVALLGMSALGIGFLGVMGAVSALSVLMVVLVAFLVVPSVLVLFPSLGRRRKVTFNKAIKPAGWFAKLLNKHSRVTMAVAILSLLLIAIPASRMQLGLPNDGSKPRETTERKAFDIKAEAYGAGNDAMLVTVIENANSKKVHNFEKQLNKLDTIQSVLLC